MINKLNQSQMIDISKRIERHDSTNIKPNNNFQNKSTFSQILEKKTSQDFTISKHAAERINSRDISLNETEKTQINKAIDKVAAKGSKESLILLNDKSFIVNVKNRKIITALNSNASKGNVFTNIDSTIIIN